MVRVRAGLYSLLFVLSLFALIPSAHAQRQNTFYAEQFAGADVATKVTNAMAACNPSTAIPCYIYLDSTLAAYPTGSMPAPCAQCSFLDFRAGVPWSGPGLTSDGANLPAFRNGLNSETLRIYGTYTDASNYERLNVGYYSGAFNIMQDSAGTGAARTFNLGTATAAQLTFNTTGTNRWTILSNGHLWASTDNSYDIGAPGANRPRDVNIGRNLSVNGTVTWATDNTYDIGASGASRPRDVYIGRNLTIKGSCSGWGCGAVRTVVNNASSLPNTGSVTENTITANTIPAGNQQWSADGRLEVSAIVQAQAGNTGTCTFTARLSSTATGATGTIIAQTTGIPANTYGSYEGYCENKDVATAQVCTGRNFPVGGTVTSSVQLGAINTALQHYVVFNTQNSVAGDTCNLVYADVRTIMSQF